jgi:cation diffusion facilitator CzcD-associated flavoprotein CzcO
MVGEPMGTWEKNMPDDMFLKSEGFASSIAQPGNANTLREFALERGYPYGDYAFPIPIGVFRAYGRYLAQKGGLHRPGMVSALEQNRSGFAATLASGEEILARNVVIATGISEMAYVPPQLQELLGNGVSHSSEYVNVAGIDGDVIIVGAGQSALELAALLREHGASPHVLVRGPQVRWNSYPRLERSWRQRVRGPRAPLGEGWKLVGYSHGSQFFRYLPYDTRVRLVRETLGPAGAWWLRERLEPYRVLWVDRRVLGAELEADRIKLRVASGARGTEEIYAHHVVAATGYRVDIGRLPFLGRRLREKLALRGGSPILSTGFESSVRGLFFVGLPAAMTFGPVMRFVAGTAVAARRTARTVAGRL